MNAISFRRFALLLPLCFARATSEAQLASDSPALTRALESVRSDYIEADIRFIASDDLEGRDTPSQGLRKAARFLRARLMRLGFQPGGDEGGFFHHYRMGKTVLLGEGTRASITSDGGSELVFGLDYYFWPGGAATLDRTGEVVFVGRATSEEVAALDLSGRFALAYEEPPGPDGLMGMRNFREREAILRKRGAIGLIAATEPGGEDAHGSERASAIAGWVKGGRLDVQLEEKREIWPQVFVTAETARKLTARLFGPPQVGQALGVSFRDVRAAQDSEGYVLENVAGLWPGSDPVLSHEVIVISAHYDHVGVDEGEIYNGADDNGSGTCGMLAIAEGLKTYGPLRRTILLLWVSGEEKGLKGSYAWTKRPVLPEGHRVVCDLNVDMIGRNAPDKLLITPTAKHPAYNFLTRMAEKAAPLEGFPALGDCDDYWARSDQMNFSENLEVPVAFLFSDVHEDYHQPTDDAEKIDCDKIRRVARLVLRMLDGLQGDELGG